MLKGILSMLKEMERTIMVAQHLMACSNGDTSTTGNVGADIRDVLPGHTTLRYAGNADLRLHASDK
jgi:hypothetical protein